MSNTLPMLFLQVTIEKTANEFHSCSGSLLFDTKEKLLRSLFSVLTYLRETLIYLLSLFINQRKDHTYILTLEMVEPQCLFVLIMSVSRSHT